MQLRCYDAVLYSVGPSYVEQRHFDLITLDLHGTLVYAYIYNIFTGIAMDIGSCREVVTFLRDLDSADQQNYEADRLTSRQ